MPYTVGKFATIKRRPPTSNMVAHRQNGDRLTEVYPAAKNVPTTSSLYTQRPCYDTVEIISLSTKSKQLNTNLKIKSNY